MTELEYFDAHREEAYANGFIGRTPHEVIGSEVYEMHRYYLPVQITKKYKWLKKYFQRMHYQDIDIEFKRRKHWVEYAETSMMILSRIYHLCKKPGYSISAGSFYVSPVAWATIGAESCHMSQHQFANLVDIVGYYKQYLTGKCFPLDIHFRYGQNLAHQISKRFQNKILFSSPNMWMAVAILLAYDLIHNCGPDCSEFFELFTNDLRESPDSFDMDEWESLRCKILGIQTKFNINRIPRPRMQIDVELPKKPYKAKIEIALLSEDDDLSNGEKTSLLKDVKQEIQYAEGSTSVWPRSPNSSAYLPLLERTFYGRKNGIGLKPGLHYNFDFAPVSDPMI